jgi:HK97 family phage major capsid protein
MIPKLALLATLAILATGCISPRPLKGGKALTTATHAGAVAQTLVQGDNPSQPSNQSQETLRVRTYTLPPGSRIEEPRLQTDAAGHNWTNVQNIIVSAPTPVIDREESHATTELGAAQKDTARDVAAKLSSLKSITWVGLALFVFGLTSLFWLPLKTIIGSTTTSAAIAAGGLALIILPTLLVGNELLILAGVSLAVGGWFLAHRHGHLRGQLAAATQRPSPPSARPSPTLSTHHRNTHSSHSPARSASNSNTSNSHTPKTKTKNPMPPLTEPQTTEVTTLLSQVSTSLDQVKDLRAAVKTLQENGDRLTDQLADTRRMLLSRSHPSVKPLPGLVSDECAAHIGSIFIAHCARSNRLETLSSSQAHRDALAGAAASTLGLTTRAALTTGDVPLPTQYGREIRELISQFGVARANMAPYPIGLGVAKPPRMGARPTFGSVAMSAAMPDLSPGFTFASLESHKIGGVVRLPRELDEQSIVPMGQFLAGYGAIEFARAEDRFAFLADGGPTFDMIKGVVQVARDNTRTVILTAGKTKPSDATLDDFRNLRTKVNKAALSGRMWLGAAARRPASRAPHPFPLRSAVPRSHTPPLRGMAGLGPLRAVATQAGWTAPHPAPCAVSLFGLRHRGSPPAPGQRLPTRQRTAFP